MRKRKGDKPTGMELVRRETKSRDADFQSPRLPTEADLRKPGRLISVTLQEPAHRAQLGQPRQAGRDSFALGRSALRVER